MGYKFYVLLAGIVTFCSTSVRGVAEEEIIYPTRLDSHRDKRDLSTANYEGGHEDEVSYQIKAFKKNFILDTKQNKVLLPLPLTVRTFDKDDKEIISLHTPEPCHFQGSIRGIENSAVALSTCNGGLRGVLDDGENTYRIEPLLQNEQPGAHKIYPAKNDGLPELKCGNDEHHLIKEPDTSYQDDNAEISADEPVSKRRNLKVTNVKSVYQPYLAVNETRYVEMVYVMENGLFQSYKNNEKAAIDAVIEMTNNVDKIYQDINIRVVMKGIEIWTKGNRVEGRPVGLKTFRGYANTQLKQRMPYDHAAYLSSVHWPGAYGIAFVTAICGYNGVSVNYKVWDVIVAHELGHSLGFLHGGEGCKCLSRRGCLMRAWHKWIRFPGFFDCDLKRMKRIDGGRDKCLYNVPKKVMNSWCGNGIREEDEECDCGTPEDCEKRDPCCLPHACKLKTHAQCSDLHHTCCKGCLFRTKGILCRDATSPCDVPEYCTGDSRDCPANSYIRNYHPCPKSYCYNGKCTESPAQQCQTLWGGDAVNAPRRCYDVLNTGSSGYHGYGTCDPSTNTSCSENALCGQIQCFAEHRDKPVVNYGHSYKKITLDKGEKCSGAVLSHSDEVGEGMVKDGTRCGADKVCMDNKCKSLSDLKHNTCPVVNGKLCAWQGVCTNTGECHCNPGYDPKTGCGKRLPMRDGGYSEWSEWSTCTKACGGGRRRRGRWCNNPSPSNGGKDCVGEPVEEQQCNTEGCPVAYSCRRLQKLLKDQSKSPHDGVYTIYPHGPAAKPIQTYCDMSRDGGGWTLLVSSVTNTWTADSLLLKNADAPSLDADFSVLKFADAIKDNVYATGSTFDYRLHGEHIGHWGGQYRAPRIYSFTSRSSANTGVTVVKRFDNWKDGSSGLGKRMPWLSKDGELTTAESTNGWGVIAQSKNKKYHPAAWIKKLKPHPVAIWYWMREGPYSLPRSCRDVQSRRYQHYTPTMKPLPNGVFTIKPNPECQVQTYCDLESEGGGWTLIVAAKTHSGWTPENVLKRNSNSPALDADYSILGCADAIKNLDMSQRSFQYRIEADGTNAYGGIWEAQRRNTFISSGSRLLKSFQMASHSNLAKRIPKTGFSSNVLLTSATDPSNLSGSLVWNNISGQSPSYLPNKPNPGVVRYWMRENVRRPTQWPAGKYGLPKPVSGCPTANAFSWEVGVRFQDCEDRYTKNRKSSDFHLDAVVDRNVRRSFCVKTGVKNDDIRSDWPKGKYCIFRKGDSCPRGFSSGWVRWDDENSGGNANYAQGTLPDGNYTHDTTIYYCCRTDGKKAEPILLPTDKPFFLMPPESIQCQQVKFALVSGEYLKIDTEDTKNTNAMSGSTPVITGIKHDPQTWYCYYTSCNYTLTGNNGTLKLPDIPTPYRDGQMCSWRVTVRPGQKVVMEFTEFAIYSKTDKVNLQVYDGKDETSNLLGRYWSKSKPYRVESSSNEMFLIFESRAFYHGRSFAARYEAMALQAVNGGFSQWSSWSSCPKSCGTGVTRRHRSCDNPSPSNGGKDCTGKRIQWTGCNIHPCPVSHIFWPAGQYGLPKAMSGCPVSYGFGWWLGERYHDTEDSRTKNYKSTSFHLDAVVGRNLKRTFCVKSDSDHDDIKGAWPSGTYCVYRKGGKCPPGFKDGWVKWDDENSGNKNKVAGTVPDGIYTHDTVIYFCCRNDTKTVEPISLPTNKPFYLLPHGSSKCQQVKFALATVEYIRFDNEDTGNTDGEGGMYPYGAGMKDHTMHYCYYTSCNHTLTGSNGTLKSPNYPKHYPAGQLCSWRVTVHPGQKVVLDFTEFALQNQDTLQVYAGKDETSTLIGRYSGSDKPSRVVSYSNEMFVMFESDAVNNAKGFMATYRAMVLQAVNGGFGPWSGWTSCPKSCGGGMRIRRRSCDKPSPSNGGKDCTGERMQRKACNTHACPVSDILWPAGQYGLPKAMSGCPVSYGFEWQVGERNQDSEDSGPRNYKSRSFHMDAHVGWNVKRKFCVKRDSEHDDVRVAWPNGTYCVYRKGGKCPPGFKDGWVRWDDDATGDSNANKIAGTLPDGVYNRDTLIYFCCRNDGKTVEPIPLPTNKPFYLLPHGSSKCQQVKFALSTVEYIRFDNEDTNNTDGEGGMYPYGAGISNHKIHYCYYTSCSHTLTGSNGTLKSPNYPKHYPAGQLCSWRVTVHPDQKVVLDFTEFALQNQDTLQVYAGKDDKSALVGKYSGTVNPFRVESTGNEMFIMFTSDATNNAKGFLASYQAVAAQAVNGGFGQWSGWSNCSKSCDVGKITRRRSCDNPSPSNGGKDCVGEREQQNDCNRNVCPGTCIQTDKKKCCVFPFVYKGKTYTYCTKVGHNKPWCSLTANYEKDKQWGNCQGPRSK